MLQNILMRPASVRQVIYRHALSALHNISPRSPLASAPQHSIYTSACVTMAAMKTLFVVLMCLVAALAAFSSPIEAKGKVNLKP